MLLARWKGYRVSEVPVRHAVRQFGRSRYGPFRGLSGLFDLCTIVMLEKFRNRPVHFFGTIGTVMFSAGLLGMLWLGVLRLMQQSYVTNRPLFYVSILLMILGANVFTTGLLAEFINSLFPRTVRPRPQKLSPENSEETSGR